MARPFLRSASGSPASDLHEIDDALADIKVQGDRYPAHLAIRAGR